MPATRNPLAPIALFVLLVCVLAPSAFAIRTCYSISNFAVPNYVNITLNGTRFMERVNFVGPSSAGVTINENASYTLYPNQSQTIKTTANYTFTTELLNVSWLPVEHSVTVILCSTPNQPLLPPNSTTTVSSISTTTVEVPALSTTSIAPTTTAVPLQTSSVTTTVGQKPQQGGRGFLQGILDWLKGLFR